jgi:hypothetical protein
MCLTRCRLPHLTYSHLIHEFGIFHYVTVRHLGHPECMLQNFSQAITISIPNLFLQFQWETFLLFISIKQSPHCVQHSSTPTLISLQISAAVTSSFLYALFKGRQKLSGVKRYNMHHFVLFFKLWAEKYKATR